MTNDEPKGQPSLLEVDSRRRISLGSLAEHARYLVEVEDDGVIVLTPAVVMSVAEARLHTAVETSRRIDDFLENPETGVLRTRPERLRERRSPSHQGGGDSLELWSCSLNPKFSADAAHVLDELESDPKNDRLVSAIWDIIELVTENPTSAPARRRALRTARGHSVWMIPIPIYHHDERWVVLWQPKGDEALIAYIGPENFRSDYI